MPLISVIVPVYGVEEYLCECVDSIIAQTYKDIEIILVDDGSPDRSGEICDRYELKDARIRVVHKDNGGLSSARNAGLELAKGEFVTFCDSDDFLDARTIEIAYSVFQRQTCDIVSYESVLFSDGEETRIQHYHKENKETRMTPIECLKGMLDITYDCSCCNKVFKRSVIGSSRFVEGITNEDILFFFDFLPNCKNDIIHINEEFYKYRVNQGGITHTFNVNSLNAFYNAVQIYNDVASKLPELKVPAKANIIRHAYRLGRLIITNNKKDEVSFKKAISEIKKTLFVSIPFIALHKSMFANRFFLIKCLYVSLS